MEIFEFFFFFKRTNNMCYHILLKKAQEQIQRIEVQDPLHSKPDKSDLKQQPKQYTNITWTSMGHSLQNWF
jgi:hypothetical protein